MFGSSQNPDDDSHHDDIKVEGQFLKLSSWQEEEYAAEPGRRCSLRGWLIDWLDCLAAENIDALPGEGAF